MLITSSKNSLLQDVRKAAAAGRPTSGGLIVAEGPHLAQEALRGKWSIEKVLVAEGFRSRYSELIREMQADAIEIADRAFESTSATEHSQGIIVLLRPPQWNWDDLRRERAFMVVLDGVQDPGNAGTIVRSAEAFEATGVILLRPSVRIANGKFLRAAAGSAFRIPVLEDVSVEEFIENARRGHITIYGLAADGACNLSETAFTRPAALVLGSEGAGVSPQIQRSAIGVRIPVVSVESLNVGIAGSIALFEAARQRRNGL